MGPAVSLVDRCHSCDELVTRCCCEYAANVDRRSGAREIIDRLAETLGVSTMPKSERVTVEVRQINPRLVELMAKEVDGTLTDCERYELDRLFEKLEG